MKTNFEFLSINFSKGSLPDFQVSLVGRNRALDILLTCRTINADEAFRLGLADKILETGSVAEAEKWINQLTSHDRHVTSLVKKMVDKVGSGTYDQGPVL